MARKPSEDERERYIRYARRITYLKIGSMSSWPEDSETYQPTLIMTLRLFLMLMGVELREKRHSFCSIFQKVRQFEWTMNPYDLWDDKDTIRYPACMQAFIFTQLDRSTVIDTFGITFEEHITLTDDNMEHLSKYLVNAKSVDFMGSIEQVLRCVRALPPGIQPARLHFGVWDDWTPETYLEILEELKRITDGNADTSPMLEVSIDSHVVPLNGRRIDGGDRSGHDIRHGTYTDLMPTLLHLNGAIIRKLELGPLLGMHLPQGFLQILCSAKNLEYLSVGYKVARYTEPSTYVSFDEVENFVKAHQQLTMLLIPWINRVEWEDKSSKATDDVDENEKSIHGADHRMEETDEGPCLEVLGFPCFGLEETEVVILEDIKATFPTLKELVALSCFSNSWEDSNYWSPDLGLRIMVQWTCYGNTLDPAHT